MFSSQSRMKFPRFSASLLSVATTMNAFVIVPGERVGPPRSTSRGAMTLFSTREEAPKISSVTRGRTNVAVRRSARLIRRAILTRATPTRYVPRATPLASTALSEKRFPNQLYVPSNPLPTINATSHLLLLGEKAPVIASVKLNPLDEPVQVRTVTITLTAEVSSVHSLEVLDDFGFSLGIAGLDIAASSARDVFTLDLAPEKSYFIERKDTAILVVRPILKDVDAGGESGQTVQVESITFSAMGDWTSKTNLVSTSGSEFQKHQTSRATFVAIERSGLPERIFALGSNQTIGEFTFEARKTREGEPAITALNFALTKPAEVTVSAIKLRGNDSDTLHDCSLSGFTISCTSIPEDIGSLDSVRTLTLVADLSVSSHPTPYVQVSIQTPGRPASAGDITWIDAALNLGGSTFTWVPFDPPVVQGTVWK